MNLFRKIKPYIVIGLSEFEQALEDIMDSRASLLLRMRLQCAIHNSDGQMTERFDELGRFFLLIYMC